MDGVLSMFLFFRVRYVRHCMWHDPLNALAMHVSLSLSLLPRSLSLNNIGRPIATDADWGVLDVD